jgi:hypothetical protein
MRYDRASIDISTSRLTALGQALIRHDLRADPWPDLPALSAMFARADLCFTDLKTAIRRTAAGAAPVRAGRRGGDQRRRWRGYGERSYKKSRTRTPGTRLWR